MKCKELAALDRQHAELHYGKYSAGYNRGWARGREEQWRCQDRLSRCLRLLRELDDLNRQCDGELIPSEIAEEIEAISQ
jgi:hypothetical protein